MESYEKIKKVLALGFMNFLDDNKPKGKMCLSNGECADIENAFNEQDWPRLAGYLDKYTESEDERIRKTIVATIEQCPDDFLNPKNRDKMLAYLERQKEQPRSAEEVLVRAGLKPYKDGNQWCVLAGDNIQDGICGFGDTIEDALYEFLKEVLDLQKEQKPADKEQDSIAFLEQHGYTIVPPHAPVSIVPSSETTFTKWSEEDERKRNGLIKGLENRMGFGWASDPFSREEYISWLKSLRPSWKPSKEQMDALMDAINDSIMQYNYHGSPLKEEVTRIYSENLQSLYEDLKKL